jgi:hypothetical protein
MLMVSIDPSETEQSIEAFNNAAGIEEPLPTVLDSAEVVQELGVSALETTIILDRDGEEVYRDVTVSAPDTLRTELESVL